MEAKQLFSRCPGVRHPGTFIYICTVFIPNTACPRCDRRLQVAEFRQNAGILLSSLSCPGNLVSSLKSTLVPNFTIFMGICPVGRSSGPQRFAAAASFAADSLTDAWLPVVRRRLAGGAPPVADVEGVDSLEPCADDEDKDNREATGAVVAMVPRGVPSAWALAAAKNGDLWLVQRSQGWHLGDTRDSDSLRILKIRREFRVFRIQNRSFRTASISKVEKV